MYINSITLSFVVREDSIDSWAEYVNNISINVVCERYRAYTFRLKHHISYDQLYEMLSELCGRLKENVPCKATYSNVEEGTCVKPGFICSAKYAFQIERFEDFYL